MVNCPALARSFFRTRCLCAVLRRHLWEYHKGLSHWACLPFDYLPVWVLSQTTTIATCDVHISLLASDSGGDTQNASALLNIIIVLAGTLAHRRYHSKCPFACHILLLQHIATCRQVKHQTILRNPWWSMVINCKTQWKYRQRKDSVPIIDKYTFFNCCRPLMVNAVTKAVKIVS